MESRSVIGLAVAALICLCPALAAADPIYLFGSIGKAKISATLTRTGDEIAGWYLYLDQGKQIRLEGHADAKGGFRLEETVGSVKTGIFDGAIDGAQWTGNWHKAEGAAAPLPFSLRENTDALGQLDARVDCSTTKVDKEFGYTYRHKLSLVVAKGKVTKFAASRSATAKDGDEQACAIDLTSLKQAPSAVGILLQSTDEEAGEPGGPHCSVRIVAGGSHLYVRMGDTSQADNYCRQAGSTMYCSSRSFWTDMIVNQANKRCKSVE
jgi:hypothetical protein